MGVVIYRHKTWRMALKAAIERAGETGYRYRVHKAPIGWWLVYRIPGSAR